ncbi:MAG TPA: reverse transcriptase domain-containing protein [Candidatus Eisenbacteria bacterium]|nr:reverse transcriptase domain-containing protein [Candidatus Eisenbacteria bacterium]
MNGADAKLVIDSGATTQFVDETTVHAIKAQIIVIPPRRVKVAGKGQVARRTVDRVAVLDVKLGDVPAERIYAYVIALEDPDLILGRGWLRKHNPIMDWRTDVCEIVRNGRRYQINPPKPVPHFKIQADEVHALHYLDDQLLAMGSISKEDPKSQQTIPTAAKENILQTQLARIKEMLEVDNAEDAKLFKRGKELVNPRTKLRYLRRLLNRWIEKKCRNLLRPIGILAKLAPFVINTQDHEPIKIPARRYSPADLVTIKAFVDENLKNGVISESDSPWSFPIVIATKADGSPRICIDYRALNEITIKDAHPLPFIDESFLHFHGAKFFTTLDLKSGFWQIPLSPEAKLKTAFSTRNGHYHWNVLPFGLTNAPGGYQRRMNTVLAKFLDIFVVVYLDDVMIFSQTLEEHVDHVKQVLDALNEAGMILNVGKCEFFATEVRFLGHIVSADGVRPDPRNIQKVLDWPTPRTITDVRGFNNLANHYARYIENFAELALPLTDLQKGSPPKGAAIEWTPDCQDAFDKIKTALTTAPVLAHADMAKPFILDPDSSAYRIGAVLQQYAEDLDGKQRLHPIAYESKKLTPTEQRYSSQERELLAAKYALNHWRHLLEGSEITIRTDHESLKVYRTKRPMTKRLARFMDEVEHYDPTIVYRPGKLQVVPDALSRMAGQSEGEPADTDRFMAIEQTNTDHTDPPSDAEPERDDAKSNHDDPETNRTNHNSPYYRRIQDYLEKHAELNDADETFKDECEKYELRDGILYARTGRRVILNLEFMKETLQFAHKDIGHYGKRATSKAVAQRFEVAKDLWTEGRKVLDGCIPCQLFKATPDKTNTATIHPYGEKGPFELWQIDFVGPWITTPLGNCYLITAVDYCTAKAIVYPLPARSTQAAVDVIDEIVWTYGAPTQITTDNGAEFDSNEFRSILRRYGIKRVPTTPGHPQSNGKVERLNYELLQRIQRISHEPENKIDCWDLYIQQALFAFAVHTNTRTGMSPFKLQYGVEPRLPTAEAGSATRLEKAITIGDRQRIRNIRKYRTVAAERYNAAMQCLADARDDTAFLTDPLRPGDLVMRSPINRKSKLHPQWDGPFVVLEVTDKDAVQLASANGYVINNLVNKARLRKLDTHERVKYRNEFWEASDRLKKHDILAKQRQRIQELEIEGLEAAMEANRRTSQGEPAPLDRFAEITKQRKALRAEVATDLAELESPTTMVPPTRPLRLRKPSRRVLENMATDQSFF